MSAVQPKIWIARNYAKCSGCRLCEIVCSFYHEGRIWPEASRIRIFMLLPGTEFPHLCVQCGDYPCINSCPTKALKIDQRTGAVLIDKEKCTACGACIKACPGSIPKIHPTEKYALICDLCDGDPQCVKVCDWKAIWITERRAGYEGSYRVYAKHPDEIAEKLKKYFYGGVLDE